MDRSVTNSEPSLTPGPLEQPRRRRRINFNTQQTFAALKYRNYRLWFYGQLISLVGTWMQSTAQGFLIYQLTSSPVYLGYIGFAAGLPSWLFTLYGGVVADRMPRRTLLIITQSSMMILAFILAALTFTGLVQPWHILVLAFLLGIANAFDAPARLAFVLEMVEREDMTNAIALNATLFNSATAVGPATAGLAYALVGPAWCFVINGLTFIAVIVALFMMRIKPIVRQKFNKSAIVDIMEGLKYTLANKAILIIIIGLGMVSLFGFSFITLMPAWAVEVLGGDVTTNGLMQSARGVGALVGALLIASQGHAFIKGRMLTIGSLVFSVLLIVFSFIRWTPLSLIVLLGVGWGVIVNNNLSNALVQNLVPDDLRGRVMGIYTLVFFGLMPIGSLMVGAAANRVGEQTTVLVSGLVLVVYFLFILVRFPWVRRLD